MSDKIKREFEFSLKTSPRILYNCLSTPSGLSEWFCDDVNIKGDKYTFMWDGSEETANLLTKKNNEYIRFQWEEDEGENNYFEFLIRIDALTKDVALIVTDFIEEDELEESQLLWENQIGSLKATLGG